MLHEIWEALDAGRYADAEAQLDADPELRAGRAGQMALGYLYASTGRFEEARQVFQALFEQAQAAGDEWAHIALHQLGVVEGLAGCWPQAAQRFEQERELIAQLGDRPHKQAVNAYELGMARLQLGELQAAQAELERSLHCARRQDDPLALGCAERGLGDLYLSLDQPAAAHEHFARARLAFQDAEDSASLADLDRRPVARVRGSA